MTVQEFYASQHQMLRKGHNLLNLCYWTTVIWLCWKIERGTDMWELEDLKARRDIVNQLDWEMTPEIAIETYLEWGTGWSRKETSVRFPDQESFYFVIYDWEQPLRVTLIRRDVKEMEEIAKLETPEELIRESIEESGRKPGVGVHAINEKLKQWLKTALNAY
jgi:hypothetical protein